MDIFKLVGSIFIKTDEADKAIDQTTKKVQDMASNLGSKLTKTGDAITNVGKKLVPVSAVMATALTASVKSASDFQNGMAKMSTLFDTTQTDVQALSKEFINLSNKIGLSSTELAEAGYQALSAGIDVENSVAFVETAGNLAKAGFTTTSTAVDVLTTAINAYGLSADEAESISNKLVRTQNLGKTTVDELASSMGKIIPTASAMNVNIDNLTTGYVQLTKQGIATAEATTYMNSMLNELGDSGTTLGGILKERTGQSFQDLMASGMSLADVLQITKDYADENSIAYNELWGSAEAGKSALAILNAGVDDFNSTLGTMASNADDVGEAIAKLETPSVKAQKALNQIKNTGIELGTAFLSALLPVIDAVCNGISALTSWFSGLSDGTKTVISTVMALVAGLAPVLIIVGKVISAVGTAVTAFSKMSGVIKTVVTAVKGFGTALGLITSPVGLVIAGITALVVGFIYLWNNCEGFRNFWINLWNNIKTVVSDVVTSIGEFFTNLWNNITTIWTGIVETVSSAWDTICNVVQVAGMFIAELIGLWFDLITLPFRFIWENCKETIIQIWDAITLWLTEKFTEISTMFTTVWTAISEFLTSIWTAISEFFTSIWTAIQNVFMTVWNAIKTVVTNAMNSINTVITNVMNTIQTVCSTIWNAIKSVVTSVWDNIKSKVQTAIDNVKNSISNGLNSAKNTVSSILDAIKNKFQSVWDNCKNIVANAVSKLKSIMNFSWKLPHLKLPHISISGSFSLNPPSVPHFSIDWYKHGGIMLDPTIFGMNGNKLMAGGEAGEEAIAPIDLLLDYIRTAVAEQNASMIQCLKDAIDDLGNKLSDKTEGDIIIPVYIGDTLIDDIVVNAKRNVTLRSGGLTSV